MNGTDNVPIWEFGDQIWSDLSSCRLCSSGLANKSTIFLSVYITVRDVSNIAFRRKKYDTIIKLLLRLQSTRLFWWWAQSCSIVILAFRPNGIFLAKRFIAVFFTQNNFRLQNYVTYIQVIRHLHVQQKQYRRQTKSKTNHVLKYFFLIPVRTYICKHILTKVTHSAVNYQN